MPQNFTSACLLTTLCNADNILSLDFFEPRCMGFHFYYVSHSILVTGWHLSKSQVKNSHYKSSLWEKLLKRDPITSTFWKQKKNHASVYMPHWFFLKSHNLTEFFTLNILEPVEYNKYKLLELVFCDWQSKFENGFWGLEKRNLQT